MASDGGGFSQTHVNNLAESALKTSEEKGSDNFIMGRQVDKATNSDLNAIPQEKKDGGTTYNNPQLAR